jgi:HEAT repeat protein
MTNEIQDIKKKLLDSHWPRCNDLAEELMRFNNDEAKEALIEALSHGKRHHVRTASIKALTGFGDKTVAVFIEPLLDDPAYETRMEAKKSLKILTGKDYLTGKDE